MAEKKVPRGRYTDTIAAYKNFITKVMDKGYSIFWDGTTDHNDSEIFFVIKVTDPVNPDAPVKYAFYQVFTGAPLSAQGFEDRASNEEFAKMVEGRIIGCTLTKSEIIYGLLGTREYEIDDIYENGKLKFSPKKMTALSHWVNFKGGMNPRERRVSPRGLQHRA